MKKGFTLIELLSVIAILALIMIIALPSIMDVLENAKIKAYQDNELMMNKAVKNYLTSNRDLLPQNVGDTTEVTLSDLQSNKYISSIADSDGDCNGYILVTKLDNGYSYNPELKCGGSNTIGDSSSDRLTTYYSFDNFSEFNKNLIDISLVSGHGSSFSLTSQSFENEDVYLNEVTIPNVYNNFGFRVLSEITLNPNGHKYLTLSFNAKILTSPGAVKGYAFVYYTDGSSEKLNWSYSVSDWYNDNSGDWIEVEAQVQLDENKVPQKVDALYVYRDNATEGEVLFSKIKLEQRPFSTKYVIDEEAGYIIDEASNNNITLTNSNNNPLWHEEGYLSFNANQDLGFPFIMDNSNYGLSDAVATFSLWVNIRSHNNEGMGVIFGRAYYAGFGILIESDGSTYTKIGGYFRNSTISRYLYDYDLSLNTWTNVVVSMDKVNNILKVYINGNLISSASITNDLFNHENLNFGLNYKNQPGGNGPWANIDGYMDEIKIYERALSDEEIKYQYNVNKSKYE